MLPYSEYNNYKWYKTGSASSWGTEFFVTIVGEEVILTAGGGGLLAGFSLSLSPAVVIDPIRYLAQFKSDSLSVTCVRDRNKINYLYDAAGHHWKMIQ